MGPRSVERGNKKKWVVIAPKGRLQWGRVRLNAETVNASAAKKRTNRASMGPRSVERGNTMVLIMRRLRARASMGPRSVERGNQCGRRWQHADAAGFNGAAFG